MIAPHRHFHRLAWIAVLLAFGIVVFGAFVRLSERRLSCPDWPTCYWPRDLAGRTQQEIAAANASIRRSVEYHKAWREQLYRQPRAGQPRPADPGPRTGCGSHAPSRDAQHRRWARAGGDIDHQLYIGRKLYGASAGAGRAGNSRADWLSGAAL
jgi:hypothetical protein